MDPSYRTHPYVQRKTAVPLIILTIALAVLAVSIEVGQTQGQGVAPIGAFGVAAALSGGLSFLVGARYGRVGRFGERGNPRVDPAAPTGVVEPSDEPAGPTSQGSPYGELIAQLEESFAALQDSQFAVLWSLVDALEAKDPYTAGHARRVCKYAVELGTAIGLSQEETDLLGNGALLHDIGKIGVADSILTKPGKLTEEEFKVVRNHPLAGGMILRHAKHLVDLLPVILHHHERYDGRGYPEGLEGERIPRLARIICIADSFDAMTSDRSYREAMSPQTALDQIHQCKGTQFDPELADLFCKLREADLQRSQEPGLRAA